MLKPSFRPLSTYSFILAFEVVYAVGVLFEGFTEGTRCIEVCSAFISAEAHDVDV